MSGVLPSAAVGIQLVLSASLVLLALLAARRTRAKRMQYLALAFTGFLAQGAVVALALFTTRLDLETATAYAMILNALALAVIYLGVLRP